MEVKNIPYLLILQVTHLGSEAIFYHDSGRKSSSSSIFPGLFHEFHLAPWHEAIFLERDLLDSPEPGERLETLAALKALFEAGEAGKGWEKWRVKDKVLVACWHVVVVVDDDDDDDDVDDDDDDDDDDVDDDDDDDDDVVVLQGDLNLWT